MDPANSLPAQPQIRHLDEAEIHFTPVKSTNAPRVWERKPSTSFLAARSKPRKVWKRFRSSFNSMKALQQLINPDTSGLKESELLLEINTQRNNEGLRGVKRQCLSTQRFSTEADVEKEGPETSAVRGRSFLETKWESEASRKRRKLPAVLVSADEQLLVDDMQVEQDDVDMAEIGAAPGGTTSTDDPEATGESPMHTPGSLVFGAAYPDALPGEARRLPTEQCGVIVNIKPLDEVDYEVATSTTTGVLVGKDATDNAFDVATADEQQLRPNVVTTPTKTVQDTDTTMTAPVQLSVEQESTLVRSALRSSLGGEDTELLNNFLSKAKAKREAKAAAEAEAAATMIAQDPEEKEEPQPQPQSEVVVEIPTPERRVLEDLDTNSPSPQKSPSKPVEKGEVADENSSASPVARRSTRVRSSQRAAAPNPFRTTLSLRRAKGTEFVFVKRTEAQELALETKRNTQRNKGESLLPKATLQSLSRQTPDASPTSDSGSQRLTNKPKKNVSWNDERLVEFEGDASDSETTGSQGAKATTAKSPDKKRAASSRNSQSQASLASGGENAAAAATTASPTAAPRGRRVRRLGPPKPLDSTSFDPSSAASSPLSPTDSPIAKRKKLTPKSPKSMLPKAPSTVNTTSERPSLLSAGRSVKTNLLKVNAGSTPMPRRVRRT
ncbi:hypothetical protein ASPCAL01897 [Aspergillus calidoustus]|uniref:Uncharacterized protein n=1 Tax=Aspergillus calidoustus TaxID=454130 RepID=A0A0U5GQZ3_ASPCI|nr:hypothetical protein ASPCAL01897 [Aspergillus calidoustus]